MTAFQIKFDGKEYSAVSMIDLLNQVKTKYYRDGYLDCKEDMSESSGTIQTAEAILRKLSEPITAV